MTFMILAALLLGGIDFAEIGPESYRPLRREARAFYPDECHGRCKSKAVGEVTRAIRDEVEAWAKEHPAYDALDLRRESYRAIAKHFRPVLFKNAPFYFECGINGGWANEDAPSFVVNDLCARFYEEQGLIPKSAFDLLAERSRQCYSFCCGPFVDNMHHIPPFHAVFTHGFGGLKRLTEEALAKCPAEDVRGRKELETALVGFDAIHEVQLKFAAEAEALGMEETAKAARRCPWETPKTFFEGLNTLWFTREVLAYVDAVRQHSLGRPDAWLIELYRADLKSGRITEDKARDLIRRFMILADCHHDGMIPAKEGADHEMEIPLTIGGCDAEGKPIFNELTKMFLEEHEAMKVVFPKMHVRYSRNSPKEYLETIARQVLAGHCVFAMFNDDTHVAQFVREGLPIDRARDYVGVGCWDGFPDTNTDVDVANYNNIMRVIEATIHRDVAAEKRARVKILPIDEAKSAAEVRNILMENVLAYLKDVMGEYTRYGRKNAKVFPHPVYSMCLEGPRETRRDTTDGGTKFRPRVMTTAFLANATDSICAMDKVVFKDGFCTLKEFLSAVRGNWEGERAQAIRAEVLKSPYWGDNSPESNSTMKWWVETIADSMKGLKNDQGGDYVVACWIYREFIWWGLRMKATPDGRYAGDRLAQGFAPSEYRCNAGIADVFHAIGSLDHTKIAASNANLMFDGEGLTPESLAACFRVFARGGGHLLQPNCCDVETLRDAQEHPERHVDLMVKVCGFSARFIALSKRYQDEVIARHRLK